MVVSPPGFSAAQSWRSFCCSIWAMLATLSQSGRCSGGQVELRLGVGRHRGTPRQPLSPSWAERALIGTEVAVVATNTAANTTARVELFAKSSRNRVILSGKVVVTKCPGQAYADFWLRHPSYATPR